jgi:hypothetical protein
MSMPNYLTFEPKPSRDQTGLISASVTIFKISGASSANSRLGGGVPARLSILLSYLGGWSSPSTETTTTGATTASAPHCCGAAQSSLTTFSPNCRGRQSATRSPRDRIYKAAGEGWFRVTKHAANEFEPAAPQRRRLQPSRAGRITNRSAAGSYPHPACREHDRLDRANLQAGAGLQPQPQRYRHDGEAHRQSQPQTDGAEAQWKGEQPAADKADRPVAAEARNPVNAGMAGPNRADRDLRLRK